MGHPIGEAAGGFEGSGGPGRSLCCESCGGETSLGNVVEQSSVDGDGLSRSGDGLCSAIALATGLRPLFMTLLLLVWLLPASFSLAALLAIAAAKFAWTFPWPAECARGGDASFGGDADDDDLFAWPLALEGTPRAAR